MKFKFCVFLTIFAFLQLSASKVHFVGNWLNHTNWRDSSAPRYEPNLHFGADLEGDKTLGTDGYVLFGPGDQEGVKVPHNGDFRKAASRAKLPS